MVARRYFEDFSEGERLELGTVTISAEEIVDPRDTRPLLCEFAELAARVLRPGPTARGLRP